MSELRDSARWLAGQLTAAREPLKALSAPQLGTSSIEAGKVEEYDVDGTLVAVLGEQFDGTHAAVTLAGPVPPEPVPPTITVGPGQAEVRWNGKFSQDILSPMDFSHVAVHASREDIFEPDNTTQRATITGESGDTATVLLEPGVWTFLLVAVSKAGKWSDPSDPVTTEITDTMSPVEVQDMLLGLNTDIAGVQQSVNGKNTITNAVVDAAPAVPGVTSGDRWQKWTTLAVGGKLLQTWRWDGAAWIKEAMDPSYLPLVDIGQGTFGSLSGGRLAAGSVLAKALLLQGENMMPNGNGESGDNTNWSAWTFDAADKPNGTLGSFTLNTQTTQYLANNVASPTVEGNAWYILEGWIKASVAGSKVFIESMESGGVNATPQYLLNNYDVPTVWTKFSVPVKTDSGNTNMNFRMFANHSNGSVTNATQKIAGLSYRKRNAASLIAEGGITASKLEALLVLVSDVIAGNPNGTHAKMTPTGFRVLASTDGNAPTEVIRMGTDTDDYFGVVKTNGELAASISSTGDITGQSLDIANSFTLGGVDFNDTMWNKPWGLVAWGSRSSDSAYWAGTSAQPYLHLSFDVVAGRAYRVSTTPIQTVAGGNGSYPVVLLHYTTTARAMTTDPVISFGDMYQDPANTIKSGVTFNRLLTPSVSGPNALLLSCATRVGLGKITANTVGPVIITVEDIGPAVPMTGEAQNGSADSSTVDPTPPPVVKNYDQTWSATGLRSFVGSGGTYAYNTGYMYSGLSPAGYGDLSSMAVFPSLTSTLSGATVTGVWVYVYYDFWYNGAGGDAYIGLHGQTGLTSSAPAKTYAFLASTGWPRAAGRWVKLPSSTYAGFASGQHRGFTLGGSGGGYERYGYAHNPKIRITWTK